MFISCYDQIILNFDRYYRTMPSVYKKRIIDSLSKEFESSKRTLIGIEMVHTIKKEQLVSNRKSMFKSFYSLTA